MSASESGKMQADAMTQKTQDMAQAQADKPATEVAVLARLEAGTA